MANFPCQEGRDRGITNATIGGHDFHRRNNAFAPGFRFIKMPGKKATWRGPYAEHNAYEQCLCLVPPAWVNLLPHDKKR